MAAAVVAVSAAVEAVASAAAAVSRRWFPGGGAVSWRWVQGRRCCVPWRRVQRRCASRSIVAAFARARRVSTAAAIATDIVTPITGRTSITGVTSIGASMRAGLLRLSVLLWLPAPLLPRDLDLLRAAQDLQLSSVVAPPLSTDIRLLVRAAEMKQAPGRAPVFFSCRGMRLAQSQSLPAPGLDLPRRHRLHPPLFPVLRRPMAETRGFLGRCREIDDARHRRGGATAASPR